MKISIIIATYNRNDLLEQTLHGLANMDTKDLDWELILADNAGNNETARLCKSFSASIPLKYIVEKQPGKNSALNTALNHATGDLLIFTDDDVIPDSAWVKSLVDAANRWKDVDLFGGRILPKYPDGLTAPLIKDPVFLRIAYVIADWDLPEGEYPDGKIKIWGPNMMVRRRVFEQGLLFNTNIGPSSGNYIMGSETEFLQRASNAGHAAIFVPSAFVYHQIRSEQLSNTWIYGRAFRMGRGLAHHDMTTAVLKIKKWMLREIITLYARYIYSCIFESESEILEHGINFHIMRGQLYQCYKGRN